MTCRIWRTQAVAGRFEEYERFAREISRPMLQAQHGFCGVIMAGDGPARAVITRWADDEAVAALDCSPTSKSAVANTIATGFPTGERSVGVYDTRLSDLRSVRL